MMVPSQCLTGSKYAVHGVPAQHPFVEFAILDGLFLRRSSLTLGFGRTAVGGVLKVQLHLHVFPTQFLPAHVCCIDASHGPATCTSDGMRQAATNGNVCIVRICQTLIDVHTGFSCPSRLPRGLHGVMSLTNPPPFTDAIK